MASKLSFKTRGVRGGEYKYTENTGEIVAFIDGDWDRISIDAFQGGGANYTRRPECIIRIVMEQFEWKGTLYELVQKLQS